MRLVFLLISIIILLSCENKSNINTIKGESQFIDSFEVHGMESRCEIQSFWYMNDSTLLSYNTEGINVSYYNDRRGDKVYKAGKRLAVEPGQLLNGFFRDSRGRFRSIDEQNNLIKYDSAFKVIQKIPFTYSFPYFKESFIIGHNGTAPAILMGDTLICLYAHGDVKDYYSSYFKEKSIVEIVFKNDSVKGVKTYFDKPKGLKNYFAPFPFHVYNQVSNSLVLNFPCYDTLYTYNRSTKKYKSIAINNRDYTLPKDYDNNKLSDFAYLSKYQLANFYYWSMYYNELTQHYILFYTKPAMPKNKNNLVGFGNVKLQAIVLDDNFQIIQYLTFDNMYGDMKNFFFYPGKGLVMPKENNVSDYANKKFYIYNF